MKNKIETMSDEYSAFLESRNFAKNIKAKFGVESAEFQLQWQQTNRLHKEWSDMCSKRLNAISKKQRKFLFEAIMDVAKCDLVEARQYSPQQIEALFNKAFINQSTN